MMQQLWIVLNCKRLLISIIEKPELKNYVHGDLWNNNLNQYNREICGPEGDWFWLGKGKQAQVCYPSRME